MFFGGNESLVVPMPAFLIEHDRGLVLVDSMLDPAGVNDLEGAYGPLSAFISEYRPEQTVERQLAALGHAVADVTHVVATHLHYDHAGSLKLFPHANHYVGRGELRYAFFPDALTAAFFRGEDLDAIRDFEWFEVPGHDHDLMGDGSIVLLWAPGHTPGQLAVLVRLPSQTVLLASDVGHLRETWTAEMPTPFDYDSREAVDSIRRLKTIADGAGARVWLTHDPDDWAELPHAPGHLD